MKLASGQAGLLFALSLLFTATLQAESVGVDVETLIDRILAHDPEIERLRGAAAESMARVDLAMPPRNPELRLRYGRAEPASDAAPPASAPDAASRSQEPTEDLLRRETQPDTESYAFELRAFPRHPFERRARGRHAQAAMEIQRTNLEWALFQAEMEIRSEVLDAWAMRGEIRWREAELKLRRSEQALYEELFAAGGLGADELNMGRVRIFEQTYELDRVRARLNRRIARLKMRARLAEDTSLLLPDEAQHIADEFETLDPAMLVTQALSEHAALETLQLERIGLDAQHAALRSGRIPWPSLLAVSFHIDEQAGRRQQEEFRIVAGLEIPLLDWFDPRAARPFQAQAISLDRQQALYADLLSEKVRLAAENLQEARRVSDETAARARWLRNEIRERIDALSNQEDLMARRQKTALYRLLVVLRQQEQAGRVEVVRRQLELQSLLGPGGPQPRD